MKIWYCRNCGYEVDARGRCHRCKQKLVASHLEPLPPAPEEEEVGYRLEDWADRTRGRLIEALVAADVLHRFEGDELVVAAADELQVDGLVERVTATAELDDLPDGEEADPALLGRVADEVDEEVEAAVRQLLRAASRLRLDPTDMEADGDVAEASAGVFMVDGWVGADDDTWAAVGRVTRRLLAALGAEEALEEEIRTEAAVLATLLRPLVPEPAAPGTNGSVPEAVAGDDAGTTTAEELASSGVATAGAPSGDVGAVVPAPDPVAGADDIAREDREAARAAAAALGLTWDEDDDAEPDDASVGLDSVGTGGTDTPAAATAVAGADVAEVPDTHTPDADTPDADTPDADDTDGVGSGTGPLGEAVATSDLEAGGGLLGGGPETSYEAPDWLPDQRALLTVLLEQRAIPHVWDGTDLVVPSADEEQVEALFDKIGGVADDEDDEARYRALEELFAAVLRLVADPDDDERAADVVRTSVAVEGPTPLGFDDGAWLGLRRRTRTLADALEHNANPDVIVAQATTLRDTLRAVV